MPAQTTNLFLLDDLEDSSKMRNLADSDLSALRAIAGWIKTFVVKPHKDLGRAGTVCPFVPGSLERKVLWLAPEHIADRCLFRKPYPGRIGGNYGIGTCSRAMVAILRLLIGALRDCLKSRGRLEAGVIVLRHQLNVLRRQSPRRVRPNAFERAVFVCLYRHFPDIGNAVAIIRPETVIRWHRMGFRAWWRWKSRNPGGRPKIDRELRDFVRRMCEENQLWGAPRIHGELLKLGFTVAQSTVSKYMLRGRRPPSQGWKTFLRNHADGIAAVDCLVVPTLTFERLFAFVILGVGRRNILWIGVTTNPTAQWLAHQITEAFPWDTAPTFLIRDNDCAYGEVFTRRVRSMGIRDRPIAPRSPWQNGYVERAIGSIRRECLDHMIVWSEAHLRRVLREYTSYYNAARTHLGLQKDAPHRRPIERRGRIVTSDILGGLHHQYCRN